MNFPVLFCEALPSNTESVCQLVDAVFQRFEAPDYSAKGIAEFAKYNTPGAMAQRIADNHRALLAISGEQIIGVIELRNLQHISLFFVKEQYQGKKIGRALWEQAYQICIKANPSFQQITVNSSPYAVSIYERLGFSRTGPDQMKSGIRYVPMTFIAARVPKD